MLRLSGVRVNARIEYRNFGVAGLIGSGLGNSKVDEEDGVRAVVKLTPQFNWVSYDNDVNFVMNSAADPVWLTPETLVANIAGETVAKTKYYHGISFLF